MKSFMMCLMLLTSFSVFAGNGVEDCRSLLGKYKCESEGQKVDVEIVGNVAEEAIKIDIGGEAQYYFIDGAAQLASDDSVVTVACKANKEIAVEKMVTKTESKPHFSILKTSNGMVMMNAKKEVIVKCKK